jgi:hypothetical protein
MFYTPTIPEKPYTITQGIWESFYNAQQKGTMNMYGHHLVRYFLDDNAYDKAYQHFVIDERTEDVVIE